MAGVMLAQLAEGEGMPITIVTAGTHVVEGQPMGMRTKNAIASLEVLDVSGLGRHRSHQLSDQDCVAADIIIAMEADHVRYVRRIHPDAAEKTATIWHLAGTLSADGEEVTNQIAGLGLGDVDLAAARDVLDPAGHDQAEYDRCAAEIWALSQRLVGALR
jgi:protein-tyrosine-phosphatase